MEIIAVLVIQTVEHSDILKQLRLISLQGRSDVFHINGNLVVPGLHTDDFILRLAEETGKAFRLLSIFFEAFEFRHQVHQHIADGTGLLRLDGVQRSLGEISDALLGICAEEQNMIGIGYVNLVDEIFNCFLFSFGQLAFVQAGSLLFHNGSGSLLDAFGRGFSNLGYGSGRSKGKLRHGIGFRHFLFLLISLRVYGNYSC